MADYRLPKVGEMARGVYRGQPVRGVVREAVRLPGRTARVRLRVTLDHSIAIDGKRVGDIYITVSPWDGIDPDMNEEAATFIMGA